MLPSRLFRNTGLPPALRSLITPRASLPPNITVQLRLRLGFANSANPYSASGPSTAATGSTPAINPSSQPLPEKLEPKLSITFTCTVKGCDRRSTHEFSKRAYESGIVLVQCPGCANRHLIADHLGWFKESTEDGKLRTVEDLLRVKGETVRRGRIDAGGVVEYAESARKI